MTDDLDVKRMDPSTRFVRSLDGEYFMIREVAQMLGISTQALRKTVHDKKIEAPSFWVMFGKLKIYLYTRTDIEEVKIHLEKISEIHRVGDGNEPKVGRPRKYTVEQRQQKQREYARAYYWRKRLNKAQEGNDEEVIRLAKSKLYEVETEMNGLATVKGEYEATKEPAST